MNPQDKEKFLKLCQQFLETGYPEDRVKDDVFKALVDKNYGLFEFIFRQDDDGQINSEEQELFTWIKSFRFVNDYTIAERFSPYLGLSFSASEDEEKFQQLCHHFIDAGCLEDMASSYVFSALSEKKYGLFETMFRNSDGTIDPDEKDLYEWIKNLLIKETKESLTARFASLVKS